MSEWQTPAPCRLFGLLAKNAPRAVILRRGPTRRVQLLLWIDWDQQGRLAFARAGKLFVSRDPDTHPLQVREIADFNGNTPTSLIAPYRTKKW